MGKIVFGPDCKKGIAFATYAGGHLGPAEVEPALALMALETVRYRTANVRITLRLRPDIYQTLKGIL